MLFLIEKKWFIDIYKRIKDIYQAIPTYYSLQIIDMAEYYEYSLTECVNEVEKAEEKVKNHLKKMGFKGAYLDVANK